MLQAYESARIGWFSSCGLMWLEHIVANLEQFAEIPMNLFASENLGEPMLKVVEPE